MTELGGDEANGKVGGGAEQTRHRLIEVPDYPLPQLSLIAQGLEPDGADMFIGGTAARDIDLLRHHGISTVVNCAVNLDVNYVAAPVEGEADPDSKSQSRAGTGPFRVFKLGLVDGGGNPHGMMLAAYYMLHGALHQTLPEKQSYPRRERGNVLVHCRGGRSRSVALVALYLHLQGPDSVPRTGRRDRLGERKTRTASGRVVQGAETGAYRCHGAGRAGHPFAARKRNLRDLRTWLAIIVAGCGPPA